ncbi:MAG: efflux RND transporter periplasmic adaptor subunit, partial [Thermoanaerobaculia bacterium]
MTSRELRALAPFSWALTLGVLAGCEPPAVQVVPVDVGVVESTATSIEPGLVKARRDSRLSPPVSGRIVEVNRREGERLKAGEPLIRLENDLERIALDEARLDLSRLERLGTEGAESKAQLDRARFALDRAQVNHERTFVRAPFDGLLVELNAQVGEMSYGTMPLDLVMGGQEGAAKEAMARIVDDSSLFVEADIDEADAGRLRPAQPARITVEALDGRVLAGRVARIAQAVSTSEGRSRTIRVEIEIGPPSSPEPPGNGSPAATAGLLVGMSADIEVILQRVEKV